MEINLMLPCIKKGNMGEEHGTTCGSFHFFNTEDKNKYKQINNNNKNTNTNNNYYKNTTQERNRGFAMRSPTTTHNKHNERRGTLHGEILPDPSCPFSFTVI